MSKELRSEQNATVGMTVGMIEVLILQPFNYAKNMVQQQRPIQLNPMIWYRGVAANCINMGSCTMIQFAVGGELKNMLYAGSDRDLSLVEEMACGVAAGTTSALVGSPLELIMIQQQHKGGNVAVRVADIVKNPINISRGFVGAAVREALWTCGYLSIPPVARRTLMTTFPDTFDTNDKARIPAALLGGLFACYLTHPFDTIKTCMQGDLERKVYGGFLGTGKKIMADSGITGFYRGATFRYGLIASHKTTTTEDDDDDDHPNSLKTSISSFVSSNHYLDKKDLADLKNNTSHVTFHYTACPSTNYLCINRQSNLAGGCIPSSPNFNHQTTLTVSHNCVALSHSMLNVINRRL
eukprot:scaffold781_cov132-Cylindrotheca_fusiformis.AAC.7